MPIVLWSLSWEIRLLPSFLRAVFCINFLKINNIVKYKDIELHLYPNCRSCIKDIVKSLYDYNYISASKHFEKALIELKQILDDDK